MTLRAKDDLVTVVLERGTRLVGDDEHANLHVTPR